MKQHSQRIIKDIVFSSTMQLAAAIRAGHLTSTEVLEAHLAQISKHNPALNAIITMDVEHARERAHEADKALARGQVWGPLHGVPFTLKDAHSTAGMRTTTGFPPLDHVPQEDSTVTARLKAAGGILIGKTNVPVMLGDFQSNNPIFGRTNNPWNIERTPGGSSGGAAAALASGMTPFEIGSDLSGSIRIPAHFCGVLGLKPTENRVSSVGHIPGIPTPRSIRIIGGIGPMAHTVEDLELLFSIIAGPDGHDTEVRPVPVEDVPELPLNKLRIAFAPTFPGFPVAADIRHSIEELAQQLNRLGAVVGEVLPGLDFNKELSRAGELIGMVIGTFQPQENKPPITLAQYMEALHRRDQSIIAWEKFFDDWDVLLCPASMTTAFPHCEKGSPLQVDGQKVDYWMVSAHSTLFNYTGHPAVVLPYKLDRDGLPIGVQIVGKRWNESRLLAIAKAVSEVTGEFQRPPGY
ncbi:Amidase [uncultured archaeon]|nr:Amidase [uncultured archaeon]